MTAGGRQTSRAAAALLLVLAAGGVAQADTSPMELLLDSRGRVVTAVPRRLANVSMQAETVSLVPFFDAALDSKHPLLYVNARFDLLNHGPATTLPAGFPELSSPVRMCNEYYSYSQPRLWPGVRFKGPQLCDEDTGAGEPKKGTYRSSRPVTIIRFFADAARRPLPVRVVPGRGRYRRWHVYSIPFSRRGRTPLRNLYVARLGREQTNESAQGDILRYHLEYILHTGAAWRGPIGRGAIQTWDGGPRLLRRFELLKPTRADDIRLHLAGIVDAPSPGRPLRSWTVGNTGGAEGSSYYFDRWAVVRASSSLSAGGLAHVAPMVVDQDPGTAWIDGNTSGGVGQWVQLPVGRLGRIRGLVLSSGQPSPGASRIKGLRLSCYGKLGNLHAVKLQQSRAATLANLSGPQRVILPRPMGPCHALRLTVLTLHGSAKSHATLAEVRLLSGAR